MGFKVQDLSSASWTLRKLRELEEEKNKIKLLASEEMERIKVWEDKELKALISSTDYFECLLEDYYREELKSNPKAKISTPYGTVSKRKQQDSWNYENDKIIDWLKKNDKKLIRVKEEINKAEIKKKYKVVDNVVVNENGEIVEGIEIIKREDKIIVKAEI